MLVIYLLLRINTLLQSVALLFCQSSNGLELQSFNDQFEIVRVVLANFLEEGDVLDLLVGAGQLPRGDVRRRLHAAVG